MRFHTSHNGGNASRLGNRQAVVILGDSKSRECPASALLDISLVVVRFDARHNGGNTFRLGHQHFIIIIVKSTGSKRAQHPFAWTPAWSRCAFMPLTTAVMPPASAIVTLFLALLAARLPSAAHPKYWTPASSWCDSMLLCYSQWR